MKLLVNKKLVWYNDTINKIKLDYWLKKSNMYAKNFVG